MVDHRTHHLLYQCFMVLHLQKVTSYCLEPALTTREASTLCHLKQVAAHPGTCLVPLGDYARLHPYTGDHPHSHLLDLAAVNMLALCHHFPPWAAYNPIVWPLHTLEQLAATPWA